REERTGMPRIVATFAVVALSGCFQSGPVLASGDAGHIDAGPDDPSDGGSALPTEECGADTILAIRETTLNIPIDLGLYEDDVTSSCGSAAPGNDAFIAVDMQAGQRWH